ncbi:hypothetical protein JIN81_11930 [Haloferula rosea]|uniref:Uncharacterized protein n=1 Tax=Haloferula rosea TaxID=490093 RepID=A0A934VG56_9BACT|nr:hypothetical protein [Haloferula rosea]
MGDCQILLVFRILPIALAASVLTCPPLSFSQDEAPAEPPAIPADLLDDPHVREELAINEFTAPSIARIFDSLESLAPLPMADYTRETPERMPLNRADLAVELGFLIADGFLIVQVGELGKVEGLASQLTRYAKALGAGERVNRHAASLLESAKNQEVDQLKKELAATQKDVELELVTLRDADLAHLISLGGWIRALQVASGAVDKQFSEERGREVMREDIADYYASIVGSLEPRIAERPNYVEMRNLLSGMRNEMLLKEGEAPTPKRIAGIKAQANTLAELALKREESP